MSQAGAGLQGLLKGPVFDALVGTNARRTAPPVVEVDEPGDDGRLSLRE